MEVPKNLELRKSPVHGLGIFAKEHISAGQDLGEYTGIKMTKAEFRCVYGKDISHTCWTNQNFPNTTVVVAKNPRNFITYINESLQPNTELKNKHLFAKTDIGGGRNYS